MDPFAGDSQDPQSLHKYLYVHGDPIQGVDPSGLQFSVAGLGVSISIGATLGGTLGGIDAALGGQSVVVGVAQGAAFGAALGAAAYAFPAVFASKAALIAGSGLGIASAFQSFQNGKNAQDVYRVFTGVAIPLALRNVAISRLASISKANLAKLWGNVRVRSGFSTDPAIAGSLVGERFAVGNARPGRYIYVVDEAGNMWLGPNNARHQALVPRDSGVRAAGHIVIEANKSVRLNSRSGTFMMEDPILASEEASWLAAITETLLNAGLAVEDASPGTFLR